MSDKLTEQALANACQRIEDFALVNRARKGEDKAEAVTVWLEYLGVEEAQWTQLGNWLNRFLGPGWGGDVLIGFALGLLSRDEP